MEYYYFLTHLSFEISSHIKLEGAQSKEGRALRNRGQCELHAPYPPPPPQECDQPQETTGQARTCCFMVFVSHSSSFPGTWLVPLLPMSGADKSIWAARLGAAAEQTKEAPLGLHARDRILQRMWRWVSTPATHSGGRSWAPRLCQGQGRDGPCPHPSTAVGERPPAHRGMSSLMLITQRFFLASVS